MAMSRSLRVKIMLFFSIILFFLELIVGLVAGSIALVADSFHMLNDVLSLVIALYAIKLSKKKNFNPRNTYGWQRSEILGALINAVLLLDKPQLILMVGGIGLFFNIVGMYMFGDAHSHHSHGHDHSHNHSHDHTHEHSHNHSQSENIKLLNNHDATHNSISNGSNYIENSHVNPYGSLAESQALLPDANLKNNNDIGLQSNTKSNQTLVSVSDRSSVSTGEIMALPDTSHPLTDYPAVTKNAIIESAEYIKRVNKTTDHSDNSSILPTHNNKKNGSHNDDSHEHSNPSGHLNMHGVWLHVLGDCLANVAVIISALFIWLTPYTWRFYMDPFISIIDHVFNVHELHVWQLSDTKMVASVHLVISKFKNYKKKTYRAGKDISEYTESDLDISEIYMHVATNANKILHKFGVHSITIQPEFVSFKYDDSQINSNQQLGNITIGSSRPHAPQTQNIATSFNQNISILGFNSEESNGVAKNSRFLTQIVVPAMKDWTDCMLPCEGEECIDYMCCAENISTSVEEYSDL
ncbi:hypothetical protein BB561_003570 [Smittium simulii]|uniref:Cation efflux protein transmembrane domain-containing protein n=1 Tax=Smittium simulii TaxID=133385 RepID=A0A2T9YKM9_9FUNG|nr:hypothetical protein BB561_003570 [Smittium simulii]